MFVQSVTLGGSVTHLRKVASTLGKGMFCGLVATETRGVIHGRLIDLGWFFNDDCWTTVTLGVAAAHETLAAAKHIGANIVVVEEHPWNIYDA
jgi:hypothetical protein